MFSEHFTTILLIESVRYGERWWAPRQVMLALDCDSISGAPSGTLTGLNSQLDGCHMHQMHILAFCWKVSGLLVSDSVSELFAMSSAFFG